MRDEEYQALKAAKKAAKRAASGKESVPSKKKKQTDERAPDETVTAAPVASTLATERGSVDSATDSSAAPEKGSVAATSQYADQWLVCVDCGGNFCFSVAEQRFFEEKGYAVAKSRCKECTAAKKARFGESSGKGAVAQERAEKKKQGLKDATCYNCVRAARIEQPCSPQLPSCVHHCDA